MPNHDRFECQTAIDSDAILQLDASPIFSLFFKIGEGYRYCGAVHNFHAPALSDADVQRW
ncbi:hypothetical protein D4638_25705 [Escherichia coli]|nr:hypothetical protein [Escherichia coli]EEX0338647.1 hypothetical protein [Escherichia coli]EEX0384713.1 hypothetical protein [Escherichia coli]